MAEIFRQIQPATALPMTGERLVPGLGGEIEAEHLHRYVLARDLCRGKHVVDVASGEGYGSALLAQTAASVVGVEIDPDSVAHAARAYRLANLSYLQGNATALPLQNGSVDVVVSFETLEHFVDHDAFLAEVQRVLRPDGFLMVSTPDADVYSGPGSSPNPFHAHELTKAEFAQLLSGVFRRVVLYRQRIVLGSAILPEAPDPEPEPHIYERRGEATFESHRKLPRARYVLAVAAQGQLPALGGSFYIEEHLNAAAEAELERLRGVESAFRDHVAAHAANAGEMAVLRTELERLREVEASFRERAVGADGRIADPAILQAEVERLRAVERALNEQAAAAAQRAATAEVLTRQQTLTVQRLRNELSRQGLALDTARGQRQAAREQISRYLKRRLPPWMVKRVRELVRRYERSRLPVRS